MRGHVCAAGILLRHAAAVKLCCHCCWCLCSSRHLLLLRDHASLCGLRLTVSSASRCMNDRSLLLLVLNRLHSLCADCFKDSSGGWLCLCDCAGVTHRLLNCCTDCTWLLRSGLTAASCWLLHCAVCRCSIRSAKVSGCSCLVLCWLLGGAGSFLLLILLRAAADSNSWAVTAVN
jgi:hypothetical protein